MQIKKNDFEYFSVNLHLLLLLLHLNHLDLDLVCPDLALPAQTAASSGLHSQPHSVCSSRMSSFTRSTGSFPVRADLINILTLFSFTLVARQVTRLSWLEHWPLHLPPE